MGQHTTLTAGQDTNLLAQRHAAWAVKDGISLFTRGEAKGAQRAVQDVGMKLHAASGNVNTQAQSDAFTLTAQKAVDLQSTTANITISAPNRILLNGGGGYIKIEGGDIEIGTSGQAGFKASMKELTGGGSASPTLPAMSFGPLPQDEKLLYSQQFDVSALIENPGTRIHLFGKPYRIINKKGEVLQQGMITTHTQTVHTNSSEQIICEIGTGEWDISNESHNH
jgi:type VI secretion system secreted protein VgrG